MQVRVANHLKQQQWTIEHAAELRELLVPKVGQRFELGGKTYELTKVDMFMDEYLIDMKDLVEVPPNDLRVAVDRFKDAAQEAKKSWREAFNEVDRVSAVSSSVGLKTSLEKLQKHILSDPAIDETLRRRFAYSRTPDGKINNCAVANGHPASECQMCKGLCPDEVK